MAKFFGDVDNGLMEETPHELNWVPVRYGCTIVQMFRELQVGVEKDVEEANKIRVLAPDVAFRVISKSSETFVAVQNSGARVKFSLRDDTIEIVDEVSNQTFTVRHTLTDECRCKFVIGQEELEQWQVRKRSLEALLFGPVTSR